ncbi:hypothetical protein [Streptomyces acidiscabies]|uniref:Uncharacterized protein n=1 Tax=Streptomyces acidiscabies TaxID=42234 RepID=A0AAP6EGU9_9ACTN|nr:hypothetical protein [Streptomyces acidiscabies]MBZ3909622.1 hypothetical protein [Streptomyces acidiscabies]MDX2962209.1 hypothetical protein [Streptomyces acidiscabies]MDX3019661.1 hypothetical protein [Streptomyces acidiscabies]MDX3792228.1 hypothetical protein [Streptomyces acidiscabies]
MTYRPHPSQITQVPPTYATPPPRIAPPPHTPQPPLPTPKFAPTLWTILLTATSVISLVAATITRA